MAGFEMCNPNLQKYHWRMQIHMEMNLSMRLEAPLNIPATVSADEISQSPMGELNEEAPYESPQKFPPLKYPYRGRDPLTS